MCGGSKGQSTATTSPNPVAGQYITSALQQAQNASQLPFNIPQAPVAGFSQDQQSAFNTVNNAQGMAQPYINQAQSDFNQGTQPNVSQFFNPYASAVTSQLENTQGEQMSQATGQLTQAAGGVGADRIAVGQGDIANQQNLATGQTMASLYAPSLTAAQQQESLQQGAGYGTASLGQEALNSTLAGAQAQLGTGGLQQQLSQAQMNAPYQQQLAQAAFPYQQAQFYGGLVSALAPGLGGTTTGTPAQPSIWSQLLGAGALGAGVYGGLNGSGSNSGTGKGGTSGTGLGPTSMNNQLQMPQSIPGYVSANRGGAINGYDSGGDVSIGQVPGLSDQPINPASQSIIPSGKIQQIHENFPSLPQAQSSSSNGLQQAVSMGTTIGKAAMAFANRGGAVHPYASGGSTDDDGAKFDVRRIDGASPTAPIFTDERTNVHAGHSKDPGPMTWAPFPKGMDDGGSVGFNPYSMHESRFPKGYAEGGDVNNQASDDIRFGHTPPTTNARDMLEDRANARIGDFRNRIRLGRALAQRSYADGGPADDQVLNQDNPFHLDSDAYGKWQKGVDEDIGKGQTEQPTAQTPLPSVITQGTSAPLPAGTSSFAPTSDVSDTSVPTPKSRPKAADAPQVTQTADGTTIAVSHGEGSSADQTSQPFGNAPGHSHDKSGFIDSPWAALAAAGLGIMGSGSPFPGVAIGQGGMQGLKMLEQQRENSRKDETVEQSARRLELEAKSHEDAFTRETIGQKNAREQSDRPYNELTKQQQVQNDLAKARDELAEKQFNRPYEELTAVEKARVEETHRKEQLEANKPIKIGTDRSGFDIMGVRDPNHPGRFLDAITGEPVDQSRLRGAPPTQTSPTTQTSQPDGTVPANNAVVSAGAYNYAETAPALEKGMEVPEPSAVGNHSARALQNDAEYYLQTGKLPPGPRGGKSPTAIAQNDYVNAVRNYAGALSQSRGVTPEETAEMWRTSPGTLRFVLGQDGRATVSLGTAVRHLDTLRQLSEAWAANDTQKLNQIRSVISREFGSAAGTNLDSAAGLIGPEIIKALGVAGAGTSGERDHAGAQFSTARSPEQLLGAIDTTQRLLGGQLEGKMRQAAVAGVSEEKFKHLIGDRPFEILKGSESGRSTPPSQPGQQSPPPKTVVRTGTVNGGPNAGKTVIEFSDGTRAYQ